MPGSQWGTNFHKGNYKQKLARFFLSTLAFCTEVQRPEDVGHDFVCALIERKGERLLAGPPFTVQVKSDSDPLDYEHGPQMEWFMGQETPFFIGVIENKPIMELYSTWNMRNAILKYGTKYQGREIRKYRLTPKGYYSIENLYEKSDESVVSVPLGEPILRICPKEIMDLDNATKLGKILREWILLDRQNQVLNKADMYWVMGPSSYKTNEPLSASNNFFKHYFALENLLQCEINFGLVANQLKNVLSQKPESGRDKRYNEQVNALSCALGSLSTEGKTALKRYGIEIP